MTTEKKNGGPAFPVADTVVDDKVFCAPNEAGWKGMSLRDYFADSALRGPAWTYLSVVYQTTPTPELLSKVSYEMADAMLAERDKK
jgi:hypothetical protein